MEARELMTIGAAIDGEARPFTQNETEYLKMVLNKESVEYGKIKTFDIQDSQDINLLTLKKTCVLLIKAQLQGNIPIEKSLLDLCFDQLTKNNSLLTSKKDLRALIEKEKLIAIMSSAITEMAFLAPAIHSNVIRYLKDKKVPDLVSVNLVLALDEEIDLESYELSVLNKKIMGPVLLNLVKSYKTQLNEYAVKKLLNGIKCFIDGKDKDVVFEIFYLLNQENHKSLLLKTRPEISDEYVGFVISLIFDRETAEIAFSKLESRFDDLEEAMKTLISLGKSSDKAILPSDEKTISMFLECIEKIVKRDNLFFFKYLGLFQSLLKLKIGRKIKGFLYQILAHYVIANNVFVELIVECKDEVDNEKKSRNYFLLPSLLKFLNAYKAREEKETALLNNGISLDSPYAGSSKIKILHNEYVIMGLLSDDPDTVIECLNSSISPATIKTYSSHLRNTLIKDTRVIEKIMEFQIKNNLVIEDISIVNLILCQSSRLFFEYLSLFNDFSFYFNGDFLERISENLNQGFKWIQGNYSRELGVFILRNCSYFNELIKNTPELQLKILPIYELIFNENLGEVYFEIFSTSSSSEALDTFYLHDDLDYVNEIFFRIFSKILIYDKFLTSKKNPSSLPKKYNSPDYQIYVKAKIVCGFNVDSDIEFMTRNLIISDDFQGYLYICGITYHKPKTLTKSILLNFGIKDSNYVLNNFENGSDFDKFILLFSIDEISKEMDSLIKAQIMKYLNENNDVFLRMLILQLFKCKNLDNTIRILEKNYHDKKLLFELNLHSIINQGTYFSKDLFDHGTDELKPKALQLIHYLDIWEKDYVCRLIEKTELSTNLELMNLLDDLRN